MPYFTDDDVARVAQNLTMNESMAIWLIDLASHMQRPIPPLPDLTQLQQQWLITPDRQLTPFGQAVYRAL